MGDNGSVQSSPSQVKSIAAPFIYKRMMLPGKALANLTNHSDGSVRSSPSQVKSDAADERFKEFMKPRVWMLPKDDTKKALANHFDGSVRSSPSQVKSDAAAEGFKELMKPGVRICVEGYDTSLPEDDIKKALTNHFNSCGKIFNVLIPGDPESDVVGRCAFMVIIGEGAEDKALELNGSDLGGWNVAVKVANVNLEITPERYDAIRANYYDKDRRYGISITGYDTSLPQDDFKSALIKHFASCGEILHVYLPTQSDMILGSTAFIYFRGQESVARAVKLGASDVGGRKLVASALLQITKPSLGFGATIPPHCIEMAHLRAKETMDMKMKLTM